jgi:hypothetical protein
MASRENREQVVNAAGSSKTRATLLGRAHDIMIIGMIYKNKPQFPILSIGQDL